MTITLPTRTNWTLAEQLGRYWASASASGLTFAEPGEEIPRGAGTGAAHIYAAPLPDPPRGPDGSRPAFEVRAAIQPIAGAVESPVGPTRLILLAVEAHAGKRRAAMAVLEDLLATLGSPESRPWAALPAGVDAAGTELRGVLGMPPVEEGATAALWRVVTVELAAAPFESAAGILNRTPGGYAAAALTLGVRAQAVDVIGPVVAGGQGDE